MSTLSELSVKINADLTAFEKALKDAETPLRKFVDKIGQSMQAAGKALTVGVTMPIIAAGTAFVMAAAESEAATAKLANAFKAAGQESSKSVSNLSAYADALQKVSIYDGEASLGALTLVKQLSNLDENGLQAVLPSIQDFASAMDMDLNQAATMVGKTLAGESNAFARYGINLDGASNQTERLALLTQGLQARFSGAAATAAETGMGPLLVLKNTLGDVGEVIGAKLMPIVQQFTAKLQDIAEKFTKLTDAQVETIIKVAALVAAIGPVLIVAGSVVSAITKISAAMSALGAASGLALGPIGLIAAGIAAITVAGVALYNAHVEKEIEAIAVALNESGFSANATTEQIATLSDGLSDLSSRLNGGGRNGVAATAESVSNAMQKLADDTGLSIVEVSRLALASGTLTTQWRIQTNALIADEIRKQQAMSGTIQMQEQNGQRMAALDARRAENAAAARAAAVTRAEIAAAELELGKNMQAALDATVAKQNYLTRAVANGIMTQAQAREELTKAYQTEQEALTALGYGINEVGRQGSARLVVLRDTLASIAVATAKTVPPLSKVTSELENTKTATQELSTEMQAAKDAAIGIGLATSDAERVSNESWKSAGENVEKYGAIVTNIINAFDKDLSKMLSKLADVAADVMIDSGNETAAAVGHIVKAVNSAYNAIVNVFNTINDAAERNKVIMMSGQNEILDQRIKNENMMLKATLDRYDREKKAALEAAGFFEMTEAQKAQAALDEAIASGDAVAEQEARKAMIVAEYEDKKNAAMAASAKVVAEYEYKRAEAQRKIALYQAGVDNKKAIADLGWFASTADKANVNAMYAELIAVLSQAVPAPAYARGTDFALGGPSLVGENGPEVVNLPAGSQVVPSWRTMSGQGSGMTVNIYSPVAVNPSEAAFIMKQTGREMAFMGAM